MTKDKTNTRVGIQMPDASMVTQTWPHGALQVDLWGGACIHMCVYHTLSLYQTVCVYIYVHVCIFTLSERMHVRRHLYKYMYMYAYSHYLNVCIYVYMYVYIYMYAHMFTHDWFKLMFIFCACNHGPRQHISHYTRGQHPSERASENA